MSGKVLVASCANTHVIRLIGDVRLTVSAAFDEHIDRLLDGAADAANASSDRTSRTVVIDLAHADGIDSTILGLLAKLAIGCHTHWQQKPTVYSTKPGITQLLLNMGFKRIVHIVEQSCLEQSAAINECSASGDEARLKHHVLEAHRILASLNRENQDRFRELLVSLESK